jgi:hypothetical protein
MMHVAHDITPLLPACGYWAVLRFVCIKSVGMPFPGEIMLRAAVLGWSGQHAALRPGTIRRHQHTGIAENDLLARCNRHLQEPGRNRQYRQPAAPVLAPAPQSSGGVDDSRHGPHHERHVAAAARPSRLAETLRY